MDDADLAILAYERKWWRYAGSKESTIPEKFGMSVVRYYQRLNRILDDPAAVAVDPVLVRRLRRIRTARADARARTQSA